MQVEDQSYQDLVRTDLASPARSSGGPAADAEDPLGGGSFAIQVQQRLLHADITFSEMVQSCLRSGFGSQSMPTAKLVARR